MPLNDLLTKSSKTNYERTTGQLTIWLTIDDCLTVPIDGSKHTNYITTNQVNNQSIIPSTDVIQLTLTSKMTTSQVVEMSVTGNNNSPNLCSLDNPKVHSFFLNSFYKKVIFYSYYTIYSVISWPLKRTLWLFGNVSQKETLIVARCCVKTAFIKKTENYKQWRDHVLLVHGCGENPEWSGHYIWGICLFD